jgi:hypothetical protein
VIVRRGMASRATSKVLNDGAAHDGHSTAAGLSLGADAGEWLVSITRD